MIFLSIEFCYCPKKYLILLNKGYLWYLPPSLELNRRNHSIFSKRICSDELNNVSTSHQALPIWCESIQASAWSNHQTLSLNYPTNKLTQAYVKENRHYFCMSISNSKCLIYLIKSSGFLLSPNKIEPYHLQTCTLTSQRNTHNNNNMNTNNLVAPKLYGTTMKFKTHPPYYWCLNEHSLITWLFIFN